MRLGSDPELFLQYDGEFIPAIGLIGGEKGNPIVHGDIGVQEDNVMVEFNIPPANTPELFRHYLHLGMTTIETLLPKGYELVLVSSADFDPKWLKSKKACESGCDPDMDAWTRGLRKPVSMKGNTRYAGGHVHIELPEDDIDDFEFITNLVRSLDIHLAVPATRYDKDIRRRKAYGKPGAYREKPYGIEYRSLSNFWIKDYTNFVWEGIEKAYEYAKNNHIPDTKKKEVMAIC